ncbi:MAG: heparinase [Tabrizicola sp.]|nr:heparinase [Tabrizicola sp.]
MSGYALHEQSGINRTGASSEACRVGSSSNSVGRWVTRVTTLAFGRRPAQTGFAAEPEPRSIGSAERGQHLVDGVILFGGYHAAAGEMALWDIPPPHPDFLAEAHGFGWLDDLAALGSPAAQRRARGWTQDWIDRYGLATSGPGQEADLTGRRILRCIHHAGFLDLGRNGAAGSKAFRALHRQAQMLARRWKTAPPGLARFEALAGLLYAGIYLPGRRSLIGKALSGIATECRTVIDAEGAIASRNPEELMEIFALLGWSQEALGQTDRPVPADLAAAMVRVAPVLRSLRHADGGLARFQDGDRGEEGRLDQVLAVLRARRSPLPPLPMGYARLAARRTTVIVDAASPPSGRAAITAHASTAAIEVTSGRRPLIVSCGSGKPFGPKWHQASRASASHSVLSLDGASSSRFRKGKAGLTELTGPARITEIRHAINPRVTELHVTHDGWLLTHGLVVGRRLALSHDGRHLAGTDALVSDGPVARKRFDEFLTRFLLSGIAFTIRFHLHPDVDVAMEGAANQVILTLKSGEVWILAASSTAKLTIEPSVYLEKGRLGHRSSMQVVLAAEARSFDTRIDWTLAKAQDTPLAIRDVDGDDPPPRR